MGKHTKLLAECDRLFDAGLYANGLNLLNAAIEKDPCAILFFNRGICHRAIGEYERAYDDYSTAIAKCPDEWVYWSARGDLQFQCLGRATAALDDHYKAIDCDPNKASPHLSLSLCFLELDDNNSARVHVEQAIALEPENAQCYAIKAICETDLGDYEAAIEPLKTATRLESDYAQNWHSLGFAYHQTERLEEARACVEKAISIERSLRFFMSLADIQLDLGKNKEAVATLNLAKEFPMDEGHKMMFDLYMKKAKGAE